MNKFTLLILCSLGFLNLHSQSLSFNDASELLPSGIISDHAVAVVDMNGDGKDDIIRIQRIESGPDVSNEVYLAIQQGAGEDFIEQAMGNMVVPGSGSADTWGLAVADIDENGKNDLVAGGFYNGVYIFKANNDASNYSSEILLDDEIFVQGMSALDVNNDGAIDFFICDDHDISQILSNDGEGGLSEVSTGLNPETDQDSDNSGNYGTVLSDVNNDGHADLYLSRCKQGSNDNTDPRRINQLFMNNGNGTWSSEGAGRGVAIGAQTWSSDFGDYDNDGDMDLFVGNHDVGSNFLINDGNGNFSEMTEEAELTTAFEFLVIQTTWVDFNNDGYIDLLVTGGGNHAVALNDGDGTFTISNELFGTFPINSYALGDLNNDGHIDLYATAGGYGGWGNENFEDRIFLNAGNDNHWLKVSLSGTESNLNGIGARISISGPWGTQIRDVKAGESYGIQNSLTQHFGLGEHETITELTVTWPSGEVDHFFDIDVDQQMNIVEGSGVSSLAEAKVLDERFQFFPIPADAEAQLQIKHFDELSASDVELRIYDAQGKVVLIKKATARNTNIALGHLSSGHYTYSILVNGELVGSKEMLKN